MHRPGHNEEEPLGERGGLIDPVTPRLSTPPLSAVRAAAVIRAQFGVQVSDQSLLNWAKDGQMPAGTEQEPHWVLLDGQRLFYPAGCAAWIARNKPAYGTHGGKRTGVGRKRKHPEQTPPPGTPEIIDVLHEEAERSKQQQLERQRAEDERRIRQRLTDPKLLAEALRPEDQGGISLVEAQRQKLIAEARIKAIEAEQLERSVLLRVDVERGISELCQVLRDGLEAAPDEITSEVAAEVALSAEALAAITEAARGAVERALAAMQAALNAMAEEDRPARSEAA